MSKTEINFLDITVFKVDNKLQVKVYVKPTDRQSYLHSKSEHLIRTNFAKIGWSEDHQNVLEKTQQGRFRRIQDTLIGTVTMNYSKLVSFISF